MDDKKLSPKWHLIILGLAAFVALSAYPIWHVLISEQVVAQAEQDGRVAKAVMYYSPASLRSYLGAYFLGMRKGDTKIIVRGRDGKILVSELVPDGILHDSPHKIDWNADGTALTIHWHHEDDLIITLPP